MMEVIEHDYRVGEIEDPFDEPYSSIPLPEVHPFKGAQLCEEIKATVGYPVKIIVQDRLFEPDILFVAPPVDEEVLAGIFEAHEIDPDYGLTPLQILGRAARDKAREGKTLTVKEISAYIGAFG